MKDTIVLYPAVGRGHLQSMVELGKLILTHNPFFNITILVPTPPNTTITKFDHTTFDCDSAITFHNITAISSPHGGDTLPPHLLAVELSPRSNQNFHHTLRSISKTSRLKAIVLDFMNYSAPNVTATLGIPTYFYYTSGASSLAVLLHQNGLVPVPGLPRLLKSDMPEPCDPSHPIHHVFLDIGRSMRQSAGVIINTFDAIESRVIESLKEETMPVFCIGPMLSTPSGEEDKNGCLSWLDSQPSQSVVFLSFGSHGKFSKTQLKEIGIGLEKSEQRFLWVVRSELDEASLDELLPEGFLERTKEKGMVVRNWAPQAKILSHDSVGGFVTHCGWNSVLEAVCEGVPMVAWPLYAEQRLNKVVMVQEMKVALALEKTIDGFVSATELGERVKELMDSNEGKEIRKNIFNMKIGAKEARSEGGSSLVALSRLGQLWKE
ncbi:hypothetical protein TanjilG_20174 [Lupinus angustifolius]|uniref:Glycosyltransferase n=1 Tax=Lupinus angustifolius TaxID=3871 RepID=A0A4P1RCB2_LUPAN|nr:PREDICTED: isoflavone 7-O-glucosyltransferase 1-like [Lupinus angustifolius]XP_019449735.1 PREDICTED: isoflavone 7-O-glucosyltransferase 1-like [Lupinus angustifolius]OIW08073.1 hypothetical protein TanjilG_20174 [Lupinus angustifolius]